MFTPFTKYFCKQWYKIMNGIITIIIAAFFSVFSVAFPPTVGN